MEEMRTTARINPREYARLLATALPTPIETEEQNEQALAVISKLMEKGGENLTAEEGCLLKLLAILVEEFEERAYPLDEGTPRDMLLFMMKQHNLRQKDLVPVFGSRSAVSAVVNGKRGITKVQARRLAERFHTSADLFI
jgi:HTH-type transcriptional regulator/antitoxin HigA